MRQAARDGTADWQLQHRYLVRRAALADRAASLEQETGFAPASEVDTGLAALGLLHWDREHDTGCGPVPASAPHWDTDPLRYVHQEHISLTLADHEPPSG